MGFCGIQQFCKEEARLRRALRWLCWRRIAYLAWDVASGRGESASGAPGRHTGRVAASCGYDASHDCGNLRSDESVLECHDITRTVSRVVPRFWNSGRMRSVGYRSLATGASVGRMVRYALHDSGLPLRVRNQLRFMTYMEALLRNSA